MKRNASIASTIAVFCSVFAGAGAASAACPNEAVRVEQNSHYLPECRGWEMVSPSDKNSNDVVFTLTRTQSSVDGDGVAYVSTGGFAGTEGTGTVAQYLARRLSAGWITSPLTPPQQTTEAAVLNAVSYRAFSEDLSRGVLRNPSASSAPGAPAGQTNLFVRDTASSAYRLVSEVGPAAPSPLYQPWYAAASADFSHVLFESNAALTADAPEDELMKLYEWVEGAGLRLAGVMEDDSPAVGGSIAATGANAFGFQLSNRRTAETISDDGSRVFFTAGPNFEGAGQIYARINGATTIPVSESQSTTPEPEPQPATFRGATPSGSKVLFTSAGRLTDDDEDTAVDLYQFDVDSRELVRLSKDSEPSDGDASVIGVLGDSDDGEYVYFAAVGQLVPGEPTSSPVKFYAWHDGDLRYVGSVDSPAGGSSFDQAMWSDDYSAAGQYNTARVTPNGRFLLFTSSEQIGSYDNQGWRQAYLFDFNSAQPPTCVSCHPDGVPPTADTFPETYAQGTPSPQLEYLPRLLLPDGSRVFFNTAESLVARDSNGRVDAYSFDVASRRISLLSSGHDSSHSFFVDASADGSDVFLVTRERAVAADTDENNDLYDLRVGGGWLSPGSQGGLCEGEACQGEPALSPSLRPQGSSSLSGPANQRPRKAKSRKCRSSKSGRKAARCKASKAKPRKGKQGGQRRVQAANRGGQR